MNPLNDTPKTAVTDLQQHSMRAMLSLSWQSLAYGLGVFGSQVIIYLMLPLLTHYMPREEYGAVTVIMALYAFLNTFTNAGLPAATFRFYNDKPEQEYKRMTLGAAQLLFFLFAAIPAAGIMIYPKPISMLMLGSSQYAPALQLAAIYLVVDTMNTFGEIILRIQVRPLISSIQNIIVVVSEMSLAVVFVIIYHLGVYGYWLGFLLGAFIGLVFMIWFVRKQIVFEISREVIVDLLKFGMPLIPTALSLTALRIADRYIISSIAGLEQVAVYDVGYKLGSIISLIISPFRTAWQPYAFSISEKPEAPKVYRDILTYLSAGCVFLILVVIAFRTNLVALIAPVSYAGAAQVVGCVAVSQFFLAMFIIFSIGPMIKKRTHDLALAAVISAGLNLLLDLWLIPLIGIMGAAIATLVGYLILALLTYFIGQNSFPLPVDWMRLLRLTLASVFIALIIFALEHLSIAAYTELILKIITLGFFPMLLFFVGFVKLGEGIILIETGKKWVYRKGWISKKNEPKC